LNRYLLAVTLPCLIIVIATAIIVNIYGEELPSTGGGRFEGMTGGNMTAGNDTNATNPLGRLGSQLGSHNPNLPSTGGDRLENAN
jgi:hypothetical protein